jgi:signal transduction histidine kinase
VNLLGNAIKFTSSHGLLSIDAKLMHDPEMIEFAVTDNGEGIPPDAFEHIFEKFGQVANRQSGVVMSTGLGLTFCRLAVECHSGQISVKSVQGKGSTFTFTVPRGVMPACAVV